MGRVRDLLNPCLVAVRPGWTRAGSTRTAATRTASTRTASTRTVCALAASAVAILLTVSGCAASPPAVRVTPTVTAAAWPAIAMAGTGPTDKVTATPTGAKSLRVEFVCSFGLFDVSMNSDTSRSGSCGGTRSWILPLPLDGRLDLTVTVPADTRYALSATFGAEKFAPDPVIAAECKTLSTIDTALMGAEQGYTHGDVTAAQWTATVTKTVAQLKELASSAIRNHRHAVARVGHLVHA